MTIKKPTLFIDTLGEVIKYAADQLIEDDNLSFDDFLDKYSKISDSIIADNIKNGDTTFIGGKMTITDNNNSFHLCIECFFEKNGKYISKRKNIDNIPYEVELNPDAIKKIKSLIKNKQYAFEIEQ